MHRDARSGHRPVNWDTLDWGSVAVAITVLTAIIALVGVYWRARALLIDVADSVKKLVGIEEHQAKALTDISAAQTKAIETLERMETTMNTHERENIASHTRLLEAVRKTP